MQAPCDRRPSPPAPCKADPPAPQVLQALFLVLPSVTNFPCPFRALKERTPGALAVSRPPPQTCRGPSTASPGFAVGGRGGSLLCGAGGRDPRISLSAACSDTLLLNTAGQKVGWVTGPTGHPPAYHGIATFAFPLGGWRDRPANSAEATLLCRPRCHWSGSRPRKAGK